MADVLYVVGPSSDNHAELRYSLRALHHVDHDEVWIAGECPAWLQNVNTVPTRRRSGKLSDAAANLKAGLAAGLSDEFMLWCDDFFPMRPIGALPVYNRGPIAELAPKLAQFGYGRFMTQARRFCLKHRPGHEPLAYDTAHVPQTFDKDGLRWALGTGITLYATVYGNLVRKVDGDRVRNAKSPHGPFTGRAWLSTAPETWPTHMGDLIRATHNEPSEYEKD